MATTNGPVRFIGHWDKLSQDDRRAAVTRGLDKIFDPQLRQDICALLEDVRLNGDAAVAGSAEEIRRL